MVITRRELNRALLARQGLLNRTATEPVAMIEHLVGLQAQASMPPYYGLWSRLDGFDPHELGRLLTDRQVVRLTLMRATVHLVTPRDAALLRPLVQPVLERSHNGAFGRRMGGADTGELARAVRELLAGGPLTAREVARELVERGIGDDVEAIANAVRAYAAVVQLPPRGVWGKGGQARYATLEAFTGLEPEADPSIDDVVVRYLAAFGPASVMDMQNWSGLTKLKPVFERLRPRLVTFAGEDGRELFDLPHAPRPDPETPAPVRLLGEYDNVLLGHADRSRFFASDTIIPAGAGGTRDVGTILVDGLVRGIWQIGREKQTATLNIEVFQGLPDEDIPAVRAEGERLLDFTAPEAASRAITFIDF
jgi:hypothetical protein